MNRYLMEFIGTYFLVLTIGTVVIGSGAGALTAVAIGGTLMALVYMGGHVSRAHYNPAVTLAFFLRGECAPRDVAPYIVAQLLAAAAAAVSVIQLTGHGSPPTDFDPPAALLAELLFTFALVLVILNVAIARGTTGNSFYGLAIGCVVMGGIFAVGGISGAVFNPAVALGVSMLKLSRWSDLWVFLVANFAAAFAAAFVFGLIEGRGERS